MSRALRIGIASLYHESNTFVPGVTDLSRFAETALLRGSQIVDFYHGGSSPFAGFLEGLSHHRMQPIPLLTAMAAPGPVVAAGTAEELWSMLSDEIMLAGRLDGVLVAPHGAGVSESQPDMDGWWLERLREAVGPSTPIVGTLDPHANMSRRMVGAVDVLLPYKTNPHLDAKSRALKGVDLLAGMLEGRLQPVQVVCAPPVVINIERQRSDQAPLQMLVSACESAERRAGILDASVLLGFHYADVPEMGSGILVTANRDAGLAAKDAIALGEKLWDTRYEFEPVLVGPNEAIGEARGSEKPVCLLDMGDNIGGGASGATTWLLHALAREPRLRFFITLCDPASAAQAIAAGVGGHVQLRVGGVAAREREGPEFTFSGMVKSIPLEEYVDPKTRHGGRRVFRIGPSARVQSEDGRMQLLLTSRRASPDSIELMRNCGLMPEDVDIVVAKGVNGPLGAFDGHCRTFIRVNTPGVTTVELSELAFSRRRKPLFPFERSFGFDWQQAIFHGRRPISG